MSGIVCAIRGGPESQSPIRHAIQLAQETGETIYFVFVVNLDFMTMTASSRTHILSDQMRQMGEFILLAAQDQAMQEGVQATGSVRHGNVSEEIIALCQEIEADYVILGRPRADDQPNEFDIARLESFIGQLELQTNTRVVLADRGEPA
ncbi:MAG: universal stress protein [Chloroflexi bacterium]|nr:universal stress protein [Chloroflexota bacterium]MBU1750095.1 universal stress protein [Chloroflexota bacterium]